MFIFQFVGYNDDILDINYLGASDSHIAVATNSEFIKVFETETWGCQILRGHTNTVMCIDAYKPSLLLASGSKVCKYIYPYSDQFSFYTRITFNDKSTFEPNVIIFRILTWWYGKWTKKLDFSMNILIYVSIIINFCFRSKSCTFYR